MQCLVLSMRTGSGMSHLQFQQLLPWAAVPVWVAFVAPHKCGDEHRGRSHNSPCAHFVRTSCALTGAVKLLSLQVERWSRSAFVMRGYTVTALRDAAPHKDWFTELMGTCAQHMAMLERSESHSAAGAHGDLAAKKPPHIAHTCTHTPWSCWGILKLRTTTLAPRYIFESATKCGMWWWGISAGVPLCENVREHPQSQKRWLEQLAEMKHSSRKHIFCKWPAGFYRFCVLSPPIPHPSGPSPIGRAKLIVQKVLQSVSGNLSIRVRPGPDCWGCFFFLWDFPLCSVLMESWRCLQLDVAWTEIVKVQQTGTQKLQQD